MTDYHCLTCRSADVKAYEFPDAPKVHIYCQEDECGWMHRSVHVGIFQPGGSEHGRAQVKA